MEYGTNTTVDLHYGWMQDPNTRGTYSILFSCLSTLFLCTWSVMHLNIPARNESPASYVKNQVLWCLVGIFGPELAIWAAWRQYISAKELQDQVRAELLKVGGSEQELWTLAHSFYACMGGFVIDLDDPALASQPRLLEEVRRVTVTPRGILLLARCGHLPSLPLREIIDKSKTDELSKFLACSQAIWMVVQVATRLALQMSVTLLEVTTIGHVLCALVLYMLWWHKPRTIKEPTSLKGDWIIPLCAFMCMSSQIPYHGSDPHDFQGRFAADDSEISRWLFQNPLRDNDSTSSSSGSEDILMKLRPRTFGMNGPEAKLVRLEDIEATASVGEVAQFRFWLCRQAILKYEAVRELMHFAYPEVARKSMNALRLYPEMPNRVRTGIPTFKPTSTTWLEGEVTHLVCLKASDWPTEGLLRPTGGLAMGMVLWFSSVAFSAVHVAAWNFDFPTAAEATLWRTASLYIGVSGCLWSAIHILAQLSVALWWSWYDLLVGDAPKALKYPLAAICAICGSIYIGSRLFLIGEAFGSLRCLPIGAFLVPNWTVNVPHL